MDQPFFPFVYSSSDPLRNKMYDEQTFKLFDVNRPKDKSWYEFDLHVLSPTMIKFAVFDMLDPVEGGKGEWAYDIVVGVSSVKTFLYCSERAIELAKLKRLEELRLAEESIISNYASEILNNAVNPS